MVLYVSLHCVGLPVFPTGAKVVVRTKKGNVIFPYPGLPLGWEGITDPCFAPYSLRVCSSVLHTIARCPPGCMASCTIILSALSHSCTDGLASLAVGASVAVMLAFTDPILMLHTQSYKMVWPFCGGVIMCGASVEIVTA